MPIFSQYSSDKITQLQQVAQELRLAVIKMIAQAGSGHPAGSLGMADVFAALYFAVLDHKPEEPDWPRRDYLILSNGHICPILYASLAKAGYFSKESLTDLRQIDSPLQGHPHLRSLPGVETTSGPLGQGLSQACGLALSLKINQQPNHVYCLMSDGEQQEGQTWEAYLFANKYQLDNLTCIIDRNQIQIEGKTEQVMPLGELKSKISSFGLKTYEIDGHHFKQILTNLNKAKSDGQPSAIIAHTVPGKGVSFMENKSQWHGKAPTQNQAEQAIEELSR